MQPQPPRQIFYMFTDVVSETCKKIDFFICSPMLWSVTRCWCIFSFWFYQDLRWFLGSATDFIRSLKFPIRSLRFGCRLCFQVWCNNIFLFFNFFYYIITCRVVKYSIYIFCKKSEFFVLNLFLLYNYTTMCMLSIYIINHRCIH